MHQTGSTPVENLQHLMGALDRLGDSRDFAESLIRQYRDRAHLSEKQWAWVNKLVARASHADQPAAEKVENLTPVVELFDRAARSKLQFPKLTFDISVVGVPLQLARAGANARQPGSINCTDGRSYGSNTWYGRIERTGTFVPSQDCPAELVPFLQKLGTDTANVAAMYGRKSGFCCFCNTALTDERSVHVGYGPQCAKNWGLYYPSKAELRDKCAA